MQTPYWFSAMTVFPDDATPVVNSILPPQISTGSSEDEITDVVIFDVNGRTINTRIIRFYFNTSKK